MCPVFPQPKASQAQYRLCRTRLAVGFGEQRAASSASYATLSYHIYFSHRVSIPIVTCDWKKEGVIKWRIRLLCHDKFVGRIALDRPFICRHGGCVENLEEASSAWGGRLCGRRGRGCHACQSVLNFRTSGASRRSHQSTSGLRSAYEMSLVRPFFVKYVDYALLQLGLWMPISGIMCSTVAVCDYDGIRRARTNAKETTYRNAWSIPWRDKC